MNPSHFLNRRLTPLHVGVIVFVVTSLILQASTAFAKTTAPQVSGLIEDSLQVALREVERLRISNPNSGQYQVARRRAKEIADRRNDQLQTELENIRKDKSLSVEARASAASRIESLRVALNEQVGRFMPTPGAIVKNPNLKPSAGNLIPIEFDYAQSNTEQLVKEAQAHRSGLLKKGLQAGGHFSVQYATFGAATFLLTTAQFGWAWQSNPNAYDQFIHSFTDPVGATGFALFMAVNHPVAKLLDGVMKGTIPRMMIPYIGMMAGSLASTLFHDLVADTDLHKCSLSYVTSLSRDEESCNKAFDHWVPSNKIIDYTPALVSLVASQAIADVGRVAITKAFAKKGVTELAEGQAGKMVMRGMAMYPAGSTLAANAARSGTLMAMGGFSLPALGVGVAQFVVFLAIDSFISEPIMNYKSETLLATFDAKAWFKKWQYHREYYYPPADAKQLITNAFDVEATDLYSAHQYLRMNFENMAKIGWEKPNDINKCLPPDIAERKIPGILQRPVMLIPNAFDGLMTFLRIALYSKSNEQLRCEVLARPADLVTRYGELNKAWREHLLSGFTLKQQSWLQLISGFNDGFQASMKITEYLADTKFAMAKDPARVPDLSRANLIKIATGKEASAQDQSSQPSSFESLKTPHIVDYVVANLACGKILGAKTQRSAFTRIWDKVKKVYNGHGSVPYLSTGFGTTFAFNPPNITDGDGSICQNFTGANDVFKGQFKDPKSGKVYEGLASYIFDHLQDDVWKNDGDYSNFPTYWVENIQNPIENVWTVYTNYYAKLIAKDFAPVAFNREFRNGCPVFQGPGALSAEKNPTDSEGFVTQTTQNSRSGSKAEACADNSMAYRVGWGVFLSLEIELRNYLRGLYSLHFSLYKDKEQAKAVSAPFLARANELISGLVAIGKNDLRSEELSTKVEALRAQLTAISEGMKARLNESNEPQESFKRASLEQLTTAAGTLVAEIENQASLVKLLDFDGSTSRPVGEKIDMKPGSNPFNRGARQ